MDTAVIAAEPADAKEQLRKLGFPEAEGDCAPSAMINKATQCINKNLTKLDSVLSAFKDAANLSTLQERNLIPSLHLE